MWQLRDALQKKKQQQQQRSPLERRTAELREKLSRISFRRHSAPACGDRGRASGDEEQPQGGEARASRAAIKHFSPAVLGDLPVPVLELVLDRLSLKELVSHAALVHKSWYEMIMDEAFWRRRLAGELPQELVSHFNLHWRGTWTDQVAAFFNRNLVANPEFSAHKLVASKGLGKSGAAKSCWRVQVACWESEACTDAAALELGLRHGCGPGMRALQLTTPTWASPEAAQEVNLLQCLVEQGMSVGTAAAYLDTCPAISFTVWCSCGSDQPAAWRRGYAVCVLDNGRDSGMVWRSFRVGSQLYPNNAAAYWISWAPDPTLLRHCDMLPRETVRTAGGDFRRLACTLHGYPKGVRRAHIVLKGLDPAHVYAHGSKEAKACKPHASFVSPCLKFQLPSV